MLRPVFSEDCRLQQGSGIVQQKGFKQLSMNKMAKSHAAEKKNIREEKVIRSRIDAVR